MFPAKLRSLAASSSMRLERQLVPLLRLLADREQPHLRVGDAEHLLGEDGAHRRELEQVLGPRVGVRSAVEEHRRALRRDRNRDRGPKDAGKAPQLEEPGREHRARVPRGDDRVRAPVGDGAHGRDERAVRLRADGLRGLVVHLDHADRLDQLEPVRLDSGRPEQDRRQRVASARRTRLRRPPQAPGPRPSRRPRCAALAPRRAIHVCLRPAITRRAAASSVAPVGQPTSAPCVLASLGAPDPEAGRHCPKGRPKGRRSGAARPRGRCTCRRSGRGGEAASDCRTAGKRSRAARRSHASRDACRGGTSRFSASGRP